MIRDEAEYLGAQRQMQYLRDFLTEVEQSPEDTQKASSIISIYKKMYHLWAELEAYYQARLQISDPNRQRADGQSDEEVDDAGAEQLAATGARSREPDANA
jgi:hypothetical protein